MMLCFLWSNDSRILYTESRILGQSLSRSGLLRTGAIVFPRVSWWAIISTATFTPSLLLLVSWRRLSIHALRFPTTLTHVFGDSWVHSAMMRIVGSAVQISLGTQRVTKSREKRKMCGFTHWNFRQRLQERRSPTWYFVLEMPKKDDEEGCKRELL